MFRASSSTESCSPLGSRWLSKMYSIIVVDPWITNDPSVGLSLCSCPAFSCDPDPCCHVPDLGSRIYHLRYPAFSSLCLCCPDDLHHHRDPSAKKSFFSRWNGSAGSETAIWTVWSSYGCGGGDGGGAICADDPCRAYRWGWPTAKPSGTEHRRF